MFPAASGPADGSSKDPQYERWDSGDATVRSWGAGDTGVRGAGTVGTQDKLRCAKGTWKPCVGLDDWKRGTLGPLSLVLFKQ